MASQSGGERSTPLEIEAFDREGYEILKKMEELGVEIPWGLVPLPKYTRESWLFKNPEALAMVMEGIEQAKEGKLGAGPEKLNHNNPRV